MRNQPSPEEFDAMNDAEFDAWWEAATEAAMVEAVCDADFRHVFTAHADAADRRFGPSAF